MARGPNRFALPEAGAPTPRDSVDGPRRRPGPMGAAGRDVADSLTAATEAQVEARRRNAADAKEYRTAQAEGRLLVTLPLDAVHVDGLPRDRLDLDVVAAAEEMDELKASIRTRGQREPIEVYVDADGRRQLKKGWRRMTALRALYAETGDPRFATVVARVRDETEDRVALYVDMVEENAIRQDLGFADMAGVALKAAADPATGLTDTEAAVARLYASLSRVKRSYIRQFVALLEALGPALRWPQAVGRDLGVGAARALRAKPWLLEPLRERLAEAADAEAQNAALSWAAEAGDRPPAPEIGAEGAIPARPAAPGRVSFRHHALTVEARPGQLRLRGRLDFAAYPRARLDAAVAALIAALQAEDAGDADPVTCR